MQLIKGIIERPQKVVIYGPEGIGKSTFASQFPNPVFIDTEGGTMRLDVVRTPAPSSFAMLMEQVCYFKANPRLCRTLVIDTADWAEQLCVNDVCAKAQKNGIEDFGYGKGYTYVAEEFGKLLNALDELIEHGIHVVFTAHAQMRKFEQPDEMNSYDRWEMKLGKKTGPMLREWADIVLFANYETFVVKTDGGMDKNKGKAQGGRRVMYTSHQPCWDAKNRHGLKDKLLFAYEEISLHIKSFEEDLPQKTKEEPAVPDNNQKEHPKYNHWYHSQSNKYFAKKYEDELPEEYKDSIKVSEDVYIEHMKKQAIDLKIPEVPPNTKAEKQISIVNTANVKAAAPPGESLNGIPKPLADLMLANNVSQIDIQKVVAKRGYYPENTPIINYDPDFIQGVLVGAWNKVYNMIAEMKASA